MPDLNATLDLLQRHHRNNRPVVRRGGGATSTAYHALWGQLRDIRSAAEGGNAECGGWLALHGPMIAAVEACRAHDLKDALTYRGPNR